MKQVFFTLIVLSLPVIALGALLYAFTHGLYTVFSDWVEKRQLDQLRREARLRAQQAAAAQRPLTPPTTPSAPVDENARDIVAD